MLYINHEFYIVPIGTLQIPQVACIKQPESMVRPVATVQDAGNTGKRTLCIAPFGGYYLDGAAGVAASSNVFVVAVPSLVHFVDWFEQGVLVV
jgi:hypothetical protein